jgi:hypothetical protein
MGGIGILVLAWDGALIRGRMGCEKLQVWILGGRALASEHVK